MIDETLSTILKDTYSLTQLKTRLNILKASLLKTFFGSNGQNIIPNQDLTWLKAIPVSFFQKFNKDNVYKIFSDLDKNSSHLQILTIYLTFEPDTPTISQIGLTARNTFSLPYLLLDVRLDPNLMGGTALVWKGVYKDYSLKAKVEERKEEVLQEFKKFLR